MDANEVYLAAVQASEQLRREGYRAADQLHRDAIDHATMLGRTSGIASSRVTADASDARAYLYLEAEQRHFDRRAALARHFDQRWTSGGNAHAAHALAFVAEIDPDGCYAVAPPPPPIGRMAAVEHHNGVPVTRRVHNGRVVPEPLDRFATRPPTFSGDAKAFMAAKTAGTMTPKEIAEMEAFQAEQAQSVTSPVTDMPDQAIPEPVQAIPGSIEPRSEASTQPPPGLLADIAKALGR